MFAIGTRPSGGTGPSGSRSSSTVLLAIILIITSMTACSSGTITISNTGTGTAAANTPTPANTAIPTVTPAPTCASLVPGSSPLGSIPHFPEVVLPPGTNPVASAPQTTGGGAGQFTITTYNVCFTGTTSDVNGPFSTHHSLSANLLGTGWGLTPNTFPFDTQYNKTCSASQACYFSGAPIVGRQLEDDNLVSHSNNLVTFHLILALPPVGPACNSNFTHSPTPGIQTSISTAYGTVPLPPVSYIAPDDFTGHGGVDACSAGTAATLSAFLTTYMPQNGWTLHASSGSQQTWKSNSGCINISTSSSALWTTSWPEPGFGIPFADCT